MNFHDPLLVRLSPSGYLLSLHGDGSAGVDPAWQDAERIVTDRRWVTRDQMRGPSGSADSLAKVAF